MGGDTFCFQLWKVSLREATLIKAALGLRAKHTRRTHVVHKRMFPPSKGLLFVLHIQLAGRRLAQRGRAGIRLQTTGGCRGGAAAQGSARLCSTRTVQDRGGSTHSSPAGIKKDCALKQSVRRRSLVADIFPVSLNVESLCFPYEIFNNLRMLSALRAVLH